MIASNLTLISSRASDILLRPDGSVIDEVEGGPIVFIEAALRESDTRFDSYEGEMMRVEIEVHDGMEISRIESPARPRSIKEINPERWCVVSTLLNEWVIEGAIPDRLMVDIQGYVRDGSAFGLRKNWILDDATSRQIFCLKGTEEEVGFLPAYLIEDQKKSRMLVVTHGKDGATIYCEGEEFMIPADVVDDLPNTVGAGDTFFAYFAASLYHGNDFRVAGTYASSKTAAFLSKKIKA